MPTTKFLEKLSETEFLRLEELNLRIYEGNKLDTSDIFNSKEIPKMLNGVNANIGEPDWKNLHYLMPFYKTIIVYGCLPALLTLMTLITI